MRVRLRSVVGAAVALVVDELKRPSEFVDRPLQRRLALVFRRIERQPALGSGLLDNGMRKPVDLFEVFRAAQPRTRCGHGQSVNVSGQTRPLIGMPGRADSGMRVRRIGPTRLRRGGAVCSTLPSLSRISMTAPRSEGLS
jgi:hypothetical protein